jgi:hypothetical protein
MLDGLQIRSRSLSRRAESFASAGIRTPDCTDRNYPVIYVVSIPTGYPSSIEYRQKDNIGINKWRHMNGCVWTDRQQVRTRGTEIGRLTVHEQTDGRTDRIARFEAFGAVSLRFLLFRFVVQRSLIFCGCFGQSCRFHLKQLRCPRIHLYPRRRDRYNRPKRRWKPAYAEQWPTRAKILDEPAYW